MQEHFRKKKIYLQESLYCYYLLAFHLHLDIQKVGEDPTALCSVQANSKSTAPPENVCKANPVAGCYS